MSRRSPRSRSPAPVQVPAPERQEELPSEEPLTLKPIWQKRREQPLTLKPKWQKRREHEQWLISKAKEPSTWKSDTYPWLHAHNPGPVSAKIQETEVEINKSQSLIHERPPCNNFPR